jgi:hypothetical protein
MCIDKEVVYWSLAVGVSWFRSDSLSVARLYIYVFVRVEEGVRSPKSGRGER